METKYQDLYQTIQSQLETASPVLQAIGDPTRLHILLSMMALPCQTQGGARVGAITEQTHLSRPAISHHLKILKEAGIVSMRSEGTKNFYYLTTEGSSLEQLQDLLNNIMQLNTLLNKEAHQ
ncbi:ArsR/SmtB family transcription factor [Streptococcus caprae]|uniref:ArsR/SmtB family transcription factor n=1 Tax=Streptococcus caprae TaxID=1640501 RepID=A0ABV8CVS1_9STRE